VRADYATMMDAAMRRLEGCPASMPFDEATAMMRFAKAFLFPCAHDQIVHELRRGAALRAAVGTRYPGFVTPETGTRDLSALFDPLSMAIFVNFVLTHASFCTDPTLLRAIHRAIAEEAAAALAAPDTDGRGRIRIEGTAETRISRAGLAAGLSWLHDLVAERAAGAALH